MLDSEQKRRGIISFLESLERPAHAIQSKYLGKKQLNKHVVLVGRDILKLSKASLNRQV